MGTFTSDIEGLSSFALGGKQIKADKDGRFDLSPAQENAIRAAGYGITAVAAAPTAPTPAPVPVPQPPAPVGKKGAPVAPVTAPSAPEPTALVGGPASGLDLE